MHNEILKIGKLTVHGYGLMIAIGILAAVAISIWRAKKKKMDPEPILDIVLIAMIGGFLGGKILYLIVDWKNFIASEDKMKYLGGSGFVVYGGIILAVTTIYIYCRLRKADPFLFLDRVAFGLVIGQVIGRWGNFFNREVFGEYTDSLLAMRLPVSMVRESDISPLIRQHMEAGTNYIQVHPTFLYEGMWNLMVFLILLLYRRKKKFNGELFLVYLAGYGIGRAIIEHIRTDQLYIPGTKTPVSMVLGLVIAGISVILILVGRSRAKGAAAALSTEESDASAPDADDTSKTE